MRYGANSYRESVARQCYKNVKTTAHFCIRQLFFGRKHKNVLNLHISERIINLPMRQLTIYLDTFTERRIKAAAKAAGMSLSKWVASLVRDRTQTTWPKDVIALAGAWTDLPTAKELREG